MINLTKPSLRSSTLEPICETNAGIQISVKNTKRPPITVTNEVNTRSTNRTVPWTFRRAVAKSARFMLNDDEILLRETLFCTLASCLLISSLVAIGVFASMPHDTELRICVSQTMTAFFASIAIASGVYRIAKLIHWRKIRPRIDFFRFQGSFTELLDYLKKTYPKRELVPSTTVLRSPKGYEPSNEINTKYLMTQSSFFVGVDDKEYIYVDAAASYEDSLTRFYADNQ